MIVSHRNHVTYETGHLERVSLDIIQDDSVPVVSTVYLRLTLDSTIDARTSSTAIMSGRSRTNVYTTAEMDLQLTAQTGGVR